MSAGGKRDPDLLASLPSPKHSTAVEKNHQKAVDPVVGDPVRQDNDKI